MRVLLAQQRCEKADFAGNLASTVAILRRAAQLKVDLAAFPELSLPGYVDPRGEPAMIWRRDGPELASVLAETAFFPGVILTGFLEQKHPGEASLPAEPEKPFVTQLIARAGQPLGFARKRVIQNEEIDLFSPGEDALTFPCAGHRCGVAICADIDQEAVFSDLARAGARVICEVAAPGLYGEQATRNWASGYAWWEGECRGKLGAYARRNGLWIAAATQAGRTRDEDFPGGGYLFSPRGERLAATADHEPCLLVVDLDFEAGSAALLVEERLEA